VNEKDVLIVAGTVILLAVLFALLVAARTRPGRAARLVTIILLSGFAITSCLVVLVLYLFAAVGLEQRWLESLSDPLLKRALFMGLLTLLPFVAVVLFLWMKLARIRRETKERIERSQEAAREEQQDREE
jgi:hypothetical protein